MHRTSTSAVLFAATVLTLAGVSACGSSDDSSGSSSSPSASASSSSAPSSSSASPSASASASASPTKQPAKKAAVITIKDYGYSGAKNVAPGTTIMVTNKDSEAHTVTADKGGAFDVTIAPGKTAKLTAPDQAGTYAYHCTFHSNMHGTLTVG